MKRGIGALLVGLVVWAAGAGAQETERGVFESPSAVVSNTMPGVKGRISLFFSLHN